MAAAAAACRLRLAFGRTTSFCSHSRPVWNATSKLQQPVWLRLSLQSSSTVSTAQSTDTTTGDRFQLTDDSLKTTGQLLNYINHQYKQEIDDAHIQALVNSITQPSDLKSLQHALLTYKRTRNYVLSKDMATQMIDTILNNTGDSYKTSLWILENFKERSGLYFAASTPQLNKTLHALHTTLLEKEDGVDKERVWKALDYFTKKIMKRKIIQGGRGLKKRAKRHYLRCLQTKAGPNQQTLQLLMTIGSKVKSADETYATLILEPCKTANVTIHSSTMELVEELRQSEHAVDEGTGGEGDAEAEESAPQEQDAVEQEKAETITEGETPEPEKKE